MLLRVLTLLQHATVSSFSATGQTTSLPCNPGPDCLESQPCARVGNAPERAHDASSSLLAQARKESPKSKLQSKTKACKHQTNSNTRASVSLRTACESFDARMTRTTSEPLTSSRNPFLGSRALHPLWLLPSPIVSNGRSAKKFPATQMRGRQGLRQKFSEL